MEVKQGIYTGAFTEYRHTVGQCFSKAIEEQKKFEYKRIEIEDHFADLDGHLTKLKRALTIKEGDAAVGLDCLGKLN